MLARTSQSRSSLSGLFQIGQVGVIMLIYMGPSSLGLFRYFSQAMVAQIRWIEGAQIN